MHVNSTSPGQIIRRYFRNTKGQSKGPPTECLVNIFETVPLVGLFAKYLTGLCRSQHAHETHQRRHSKEVS